MQTTGEFQFGALYRQIWDFLSAFGVDDSLGEGDFDICTDNYNNRDFYILVNNIAVLRPSWITGIQQILQRVGGPWVVHVRLGIPANAELAEVDSAGLEISRDRAVEVWDRNYLARAFGKDFHFA
jgi:hypothetical protein